MLLDIRNLAVAYGPIQALHGVTLSVAAGEIVCVMGPNGAGKTTLVRAIFGQAMSVAGSIRVFEQDTRRLTTPQIVHLGAAVCPEGRQLFASLTVEESLMLAGLHLRVSVSKRRALQERVFRLFPILADRRRQRAGTLSGGEQQMLALSMALISDPKLLVVDEPALGLAPPVVKVVFAALQSIARDGTAVLLIEQNAVAALKIAHRGYVLRQGEVVCQGTPETLTHFLLRGEGYLRQKPNDSPNTSPADNPEISSLP